MNNKKPRKFYRVAVYSNNALNFNNGANVSNSWYQVILPGIMDDPFKKWQWSIDQWYVNFGAGSLYGL